MTLRVALTGPLSARTLLPYLSVARAEEVPEGLGGQPVATLAEGLLEAGVELTVITLDANVTDEVVLAGPNLQLCVGPYRPRHRARDAFRNERAYIAAALRREQPDIVHAHWTYEFALGALASGRPTLTTIHDWGPAILRYHPHPYRVVRLLMQAETLRRGRHFTAVSPYIEQRVGKWFRRRAHVVPNGLQDSLFQHVPRPWAGDRPVLVAANSGFGALKNVRTLLCAFPDVRRQLRDPLLVLLGNDYEADGPAHRWAQQRGLDAGVVFRGAVPHERLIAEFRSAHLLVHPSLEESFGMVLLEAMAQGLPVLGGLGSGAVPWLLDGGSAGVLVDVRSPERLAAGIVNTLDDRGKWCALSQRSYAHVSKHFRASRIVEQYRDLYEMVVSQETTWTRP